MDARLNVTLNGQNGDLVDMIPSEMSDDEIKRVVIEAVETGGIPGIQPVQGVDLTGFVVERFAEGNGLPSRVFVRPKTDFGG